jgi:transcriptional regulator of PTS gene
MPVLELGHIDHIKRNNTGKVYQLIDRHGPISRIDLSKLSQLAPASITKITRELLQSQLVTECDSSHFIGRGRPAIALMTQHASWQFLSIHVALESVTLGLHELNGHVLAFDVFDLELDFSQFSGAQLLACIHSFFADHKADLQRIMALVLIFPGALELGKENIFPMSRHEMQTSALTKLLENETGLTVLVSQDVQAKVLGERWFTENPLPNNTILVVVDKNINVSLWLNDEVMETEFSRLGQLNHWAIDPLGARCHCGHYGCLEMAVSTSEILNTVRNQLADGRPSLLSGTPLTVASLCAMGVKGDALAKNTLVGVGLALGKALALLVTFFNPSEIRLASPYNDAKEIVYPAILSSLQQNAFLPHVNHLTIQPCLLPFSSLLPAAGLVKQALYDGQLLINLLNG